MLQLYGFPLSLNVERVALALAHKGVPTEVVLVDPADRAPVREVSGQDLVPVVALDGQVVSDSTTILRWLEARFPEPPLFPAGRARREEVDVFLDWFDRVWKRPPNRIYLAEGEPTTSDPERIERWGRSMTDSLDRFEALLDGRDHLLGDDLSVADCAAWPFLRFAVQKDPSDPWRFHHILMEWLVPGSAHGRILDWIDRMAERPQIAIPPPAPRP